MDHDIKKQDEIWTADNRRLGFAMALYYRLNDIDPDLQLYAAYLAVNNFDYGEEFYIPTDFISGKDAQSGRLELSVPLSKVMDRTWFRLPDFIAKKQFQLEKLPEKQTSNE